MDTFCRYNLWFPSVVHSLGCLRRFPASLHGQNYFPSKIKTLLDLFQGWHFHWRYKGNSGWIGWHLSANQVSMASTYSSVIIFFTATPMQKINRCHFHLRLTLMAQIMSFMKSLSWSICLFNVLCDEVEGVHKALLFPEVYGCAIVWDVWAELVALSHRTPFLFETMTDRKAVVIQSRIFECNEPATLRKMTESILFRYLRF